MKDYIILEFKKEEDLTSFVKGLMKSENGCECFERLGHNGVDFYIELKPQYSEGAED